MSKKLISMLLAVVMLVSVFAVTASAAGMYKDTEGHWGEEFINRWSDRGVLVGFGDETYHPDENLTRAQAASVFTKLMKLTQKADTSAYTDMIPGYWYTNDIGCCVKKGILVGTSATTMGPDDFITREQFFTMFARAFKLAPENTCEKTIADINDASDWAKTYINALANHGHLDRVLEKGLAPKELADRTTVVAVIDSAIATYANEPGSTVTSTDKGLTLVVADGVTVKGDTANVMIAVPGEDGKQTQVTLDGAKATNELTVISNTRVVLKNGSEAKEAYIEQTATGAEIVVEGGSKANNVTIDAENVTVSGAGTVPTAYVNANNADIETKGTVATVADGVTGTKVPNGKIAGEEKEEEATHSYAGGGSNTYTLTLAITDGTTSYGPKSTAIAATNAKAVASAAASLATSNIEGLRAAYPGTGLYDILMQMIASTNTDAEWRAFVSASTCTDAAVKTKFADMFLTNQTIGATSFDVTYPAANGVSYTVTVTIA